MNWEHRQAVKQKIVIGTRGSKLALWQAEHIAARLRDEAGLTVWSPHENGLPASATWHEHMRTDIAALMRCKALATHGSWQSSRGAQIEVKLAKSLDMEVYPYQVWIPHPALRGNQKK